MTAHPVIAQAILRAPGNIALLNMTKPLLTKDSFESFASQDLIIEASRHLQELGFQVLTATPIALSIAGERELVERIFKTHLREQHATIMCIGNDHIEALYYESITPPVIPDDLLPAVIALILDGPASFS